MKNKKLIIIPVLLVILCMSIGVGRLVNDFNRKPNMTSQQLVIKLKATKPSITNIIVYDEKTDKNKLLGRPNQYISKVNFADSNIEQIDNEHPNGGSIETFNKVSDLKTRKQYIESIIKTSPNFTEYMFVNGNYLLRLSKDLPRDQVDKYKEAFMSIK